MAANPKAPAGGAPAKQPAPAAGPAAPAEPALPASYGPLKIYLDKGKQVDKLNPVVGYYCRMHVMKEALKQPKDKRTKEDTAYLGFLMGWLEAHKAHKQPDAEAKATVEGFALNVFNGADATDRKGQADKNTALAFKAASVYMEVCKQWGEFSSDIEEKYKYARWKAADISKALREGRAPKPGGVDDDNKEAGGAPDGAAPGGPPAGGQKPPATAPTNFTPPPAQQQQPPAQSSNNNAAPNMAIGAAFSFTGGPPATAPEPQQRQATAPPVQHQPEQFPAFNPAHSQPAATAPAANYGSYGPPSGPTAPVSAPRGGIAIEPVFPKGIKDRTGALNEGEKLLKHAASALRFDDINTSVAKMREAIAVMLPYCTKL